MSAALGSASLLLALVGAAAGIAALLAGRRRPDSRWPAWGRMAAVSVFACVTAAVLAMESALIGFDFSLRYVAVNVNRATPLLFRIIGLWGALEGSILLWAWILTGLTVLAAFAYRDRHPE